MPEDLIGATVGGLTRLLGKRTEMAERRELAEEETLRKMGLWKMEQRARKQARIEEREWQEGMAATAHKRRLAQTQRKEDIARVEREATVESTLAGIGLGSALDTPATVAIRNEAERLEEGAQAAAGTDPMRAMFMKDQADTARATIQMIAQKGRVEAAVPQDVERDILSGVLKSASQAKTIIAQRREKAAKQTARTTNAAVMEKAGAPAWLVQSVRTGESSLPTAMILHEKEKAGELAGKRPAPRAPTETMQKRARDVLQSRFDAAGSPVTKADLLAFGKAHPEIWEPFGVTDDAMKVAIIKRLWAEWYAPRAGVE